MNVSFAADQRVMRDIGQKSGYRELPKGAFAGPTEGGRCSPAQAGRPAAAPADLEHAASRSYRVRPVFHDGRRQLFGPVLLSGATMADRERFSTSRFRPGILATVLTGMAGVTIPLTLAFVRRHRRLASTHSAWIGLCLAKSKKNLRGSMSRYLRAALLLLLLASCGGGNYSAPRDLDDACSIVRQRPSYLSAMKDVQRRWGLPVAVQMATIHQESKFIGNARTPFRYALGVIPMGRQSSAYGFSQALDDTWDEYRRETRNFGAKRDRIDDATDFMGWYMYHSNQRLGIAMSDARNQYLAYHEGRTGFANGSYNAKAWLVEVADKVSARAGSYAAQLRSCGKL